MQRHRNPSYGYRSNPIGIGGSGSGGGVAAGGTGYRNYNRSGFGRGQPPPPRRIDIFLEAGKLATEYLVSKGLLPPNSLNAKWQNSNLKTQIGGGDGVSDAVSGTRRRLSDDYTAGTATSSRDGIRARRTTGSFKNPAYEYTHEINRSSSMSEKAKLSSDKQEGDSYSGSMEEQRSGKEGATTSSEQKSISGDLESKNHNSGNVETPIENQQNQSPDDNNSSIETPVSEQVIADDVKNPNLSTEEMITDDSNHDSENKPIVKEENTSNSIISNSISSDLLTLIRSNKVPTRTRSSIKASKSEPGDKNQEIKNEPKIEEEKEEEEEEKYKFGQKGVCTRSQSFPQRFTISEQESNEEQEFTRCNSDLLRGEKRSLHDDNNNNTESSKKLKDWNSSTNSQTDDYSEEKQQLFPSSLASFKICDLNLVGASESLENNNHNQGTNKVNAFSTPGQTKQDPVTVDFDLSMNNGKEVEIIDLDSDTIQEDDKEEDFGNSERREEAIFTDLESFPDSMQRVSEIPQDGYGLMISELLEADDIPNSGVNSIHNEINLQNEEGILGDDESIYMSLGEIPISFVPVWDQQPSQGYDKRY